MKKVLVVIPSYSSGGGAEKILSEILVNGNFGDYHIDIVEIYKGSNGNEALPSNVNVVNSFIHYRDLKIIKLIKEQSAKRFPNLFRKYLIKDDSYDIEIIFEILYPDFNFTSKQGVKKIYWVHGSIEHFAKSNLYWRKKRYEKYFSEADNIVAISNRTEESVKNIYPKYASKVKKIYNGYNFNKIISLSEESIDIKLNNNSIVSIGRIEKEKGVDRSLDILKNIHSIGKKYHLYFVGSGSLEGVLKERAKEYGIDDYVHFLGYKKNPYKYLKQAKCLLSMSMSEGFPGVFVESLALGVPIVTTDVGGSEELTNNNKFGSVIYDNEGAANAIVDYIEENKVLNIEEVNNFLSNFTLDKQIKELKKMLL